MVLSQLLIYFRIISEFNIHAFDTALLAFHRFSCEDSIVMYVRNCIIWAILRCPRKWKTWSSATGGFYKGSGLPSLWEMFIFSFPFSRTFTTLELTQTFPLWLGYIFHHLCHRHRFAPNVPYVASSITWQLFLQWELLCVEIAPLSTVPSGQISSPN